MCACLQTHVRDYRQVSYDTGNAKKEVSTGWVSPPRGPSDGAGPRMAEEASAAGFPAFFDSPFSRNVDPTPSLTRCFFFSILIPLQPIKMEDNEHFVLSPECIMGSSCPHASGDSWVSTSTVISKSPSWSCWIHSPRRAP